MKRTNYFSGVQDVDIYRPMPRTNVKISNVKSSNSTVQTMNAPNNNYGVVANPEVIRPTDDNIDTIQATVASFKDKIKNSEAIINLQIKRIIKTQEFNNNLTKAYLANIRSLGEAIALLKDVNGVLEQVQTSMGTMAADLTGINESKLENLYKLSNQQVVTLQNSMKKDIANVQMISKQYANNTATDGLGNSVKYNQTIKAEADALKRELQQMGGGKTQTRKQKRLKQ